MKQEDIICFNRKIAESNATTLICVMFEIYFTHEAEALEALKTNNQEAYVNATRLCGQVAEQLRNALDFKYEISKQLFSLYTFVEEKMAQAMYKKREQEILEARKVMEALQEAFRGVAKQDDSKPIMQNAQSITVGLTYGKNSLNESVAKDIGTRGFWV